MLSAATSPMDRPTPPQGRTDEEQAIMREAARRRSLLEGTWSPLQVAHNAQQLGPLRCRIVGIPDTSANLFDSIISQTSTLYDTEPEQTGQDKIKASFDGAGWWADARQLQRYVQGLGEAFVYVGWDAAADGGTDEATFTIITRDVCWYDTAPANPNRIVRFGWARKRVVPGDPAKTRAWFWEVWDISDPKKPSYKICSNDMQRDMTKEFGVDPTEWSGENYPYRDEKKRPRLPIARYAMRGSTSTVTPYAQSEVVFGTLQVGLLWTAAVHGMLRASWDQRVLVNGRVKGGTVEKVAGTNGQSIRTLTPDPTGIMQVEGENATISSWGASIDITKAEAFCRLYEGRLAVHFGLSPSDIVVESLNPASGASITVSQAGKRAIQARQRPQFARGDRELADIVAMVLRAWQPGAGDVSAEKFRLRYAGVALTPTERVTVVSYVKAEHDLGVISLEDAWLELHPGTDRDQAAAALRKVELEAERRALKAQLAAQPADGNAPTPEGDPDADDDASADVAGEDGKRPPVNEKAAAGKGAKAT